MHLNEEEIMRVFCGKLIAVFKENCNDELLSKKDLCERILNMDINTAEAHIINQKGFPFVKVGSLKRYPKYAVEEWIKQNTEYVNY